NLPDPLPAGTAALAGYANGAWPSAADISARFPDVAVLSIDVLAAGVGGVLDVETGDATPADAPAWTKDARARDVGTPWVYLNLSTWPAAVAAFRRADVTPPAWWIASWGAT